MLNIAYYEECTASEGPGRRFALWTQGCSIRCPGCINPELNAFTGGSWISVSKLSKIISDATERYKLDGISILGGEPFDQPEEIAHLLDTLKTVRKLPLNVIIYTGYTHSQLKRKKDPVINRILDMTDALVDGPYDEKNRTMNLYLRGSTNQEIVILNHKEFREEDFRQKNSVDIIIDEDGSISLTGFPFPDIGS